MSAPWQRGRHPDTPWRLGDDDVQILQHHPAAHGATLMRALEEIIIRNARAAGREGGHADTDGDDRLASAIHAAAIEHHRLHDVLIDGPDLNDESYLQFTTGYLRGRSEG